MRMPMKDHVLTPGEGTVQCAPRAIVKPSKFDRDLTTLGQSHGPSGERRYLKEM